MKKILSAFVGSAIIFGYSLSANAVNLVANHSFEDVVIGYPYISTNLANVPNWTRSGSAGDAAIWRVGYSDGGGSIITAGEGSQFVTMGGGWYGSGTTNWEQTLTGLTPGLYNLSFMIAAEGTCCGTQTIGVSFTGSNTLGQSFSVTPSTGNYWKDWETKSMSFNVTGSSATIKFSYTGQYDMGLDNVIVEDTHHSQVPEPASLLMLGSGLIGLAALRRSIFGRQA